MLKVLLLLNTLHQITCARQENPAKFQLFCEVGISVDKYSPSEKYALCDYPKETYCTKIRFEEAGPNHKLVKYVTACAHRQTCSRAGCAVSATPAINTITVVTCCCNHTRCNRDLDVDSLLLPSFESSEPAGSGDDSMTVRHALGPPTSRAPAASPTPLPLFSSSSSRPLPRTRKPVRQRTRYPSHGRRTPPPSPLTSPLPSQRQRPSTLSPPHRIPVTPPSLRTSPSLPERTTASFTYPTPIILAEEEAIEVEVVFQSKTRGCPQLLWGLLPVILVFDAVLYW